MSNWVTLTGRDIRLMDAERSIMDNATPVQSLDTCVASATNTVRGYVEGGANTMEAIGVPPECVEDVLTLARVHLTDIAKRISAVTQGSVSTPDIATGKWGSKIFISMRTDFAPPLSPPPQPPALLTFDGGLTIVHITP